MKGVGCEQVEESRLELGVTRSRVQMKSRN